MHLRVLFRTFRIVKSNQYLRITRTMSEIANNKPGLVLKNDVKLLNEKSVGNAQTQHNVTENGESILIFKSDVIESSFKNEENCGVWKEDFKVNHNEPSEIIQLKKDDVDSNVISKVEIKRKQDDLSKGTQPPKKKKKRTKFDFINKDRPGFTEDRYDETSYYFENGLRKVYPYFFTFTTFAKGRWIGEKIIDVFIREFRAHPEEEYERAIINGSLTVNDEKVPVDYKLQHNDFLSNTVHRHEIPVVDHPIQIIHLDEDVCIVNKPASIPVHPCGRYRHNTVVFILAKEYNLKNLKPIHRLDRLTSGLLLLGRNLKRSREMQTHIDQRLVQKEYVCKVEGKFPDTQILCEEPIEAISHKIGVVKVSKEKSDKTKACSTIFELLRYDSKSNTSIVTCKPKTGRMHQIRVHLQYLGYPIVNDPLYNDQVFGPLKGKGGDFGGKSDEELIEKLIEIHNADNFLGLEDGSIQVLPQSVKNPVSHRDISIPVTDNDKSCQTSYEQPDSTFDPSKMTFDETCVECKKNLRDPNPEQLVMYLHALKYKGPDWEYESPLPYWAEEGFDHTV
uniref:CSON012854 protein n=1 Tax=Culicoides sonorensis TaxID=179676 RepID=A0A336LLV6_CULSO